MSKSATVLIALLGLAIATAAVIWLGARHITDAIAHIGWIGLAYVGRMAAGRVRRAGSCAVRPVCHSPRSLG